MEEIYERSIVFGTRSCLVSSLTSKAISNEDTAIDSFVSVLGSSASKEINFSFPKFIFSV